MKLCSADELVLAEFQPLAMEPEFHLLDVNVLVALTWPQHVHHLRAHRWFVSLGGQWGTTPVTESAFLRLSTNAKVVGVQVPMAQALAMLGAMHSVPGHRFVPDSRSFVAPITSIDRLVTSSQVTDPHLVEVAAASGGILATLDREIPQLVADADRRYVLLLP